MARFYGTKILDGEINQRTGEAWKLEDVPKLFRKATERWLTDHEEA